MPTPEEIAAAALVAAAAPIETPPVEPTSTPPAEEPSRADLWAEIEATEKAKTEPVKVEEEAPPPPAEEEPKVEKPGIWANATPEQIAARDEMVRRSRSTGSRIGALQRKIKSLQAAVGDGSHDTKKAREAVDAVKSDYPEIAQPMEQFVETLDARAEADGKRISDELNAAIAEHKDIVDEEEAALTRAHPDWFETLTKDENRKKVFTTWIGFQPPSVMDAATRNKNGITDAAGAADVIGRFKEYLASLTPTEAPPPQSAITAPPAQQQQPAAPPPQPSLNDRRQRQLASTAAPKGSGPAAVNGLPDANSGDRSAHWNAFEQLDAQRRQAAAR